MKRIMLFGVIALVLAGSAGVASASPARGG